VKLNLKIIIFQITEHQQPIINQSIYNGGEELTDEEIQKFTLKDPNNEIINSYEDNRDLLKTYYHVKVVLNKAIDPIFNRTELVLTDIIRTDKEIKHL
jgi:hypothetical protein